VGRRAHGILSRAIGYSVGGERAGIKIYATAQSGRMTSAFDTGIRVLQNTNLHG
jgi:hypothetical protein